MGADVLATQGARAKAAMILTMLNRINSVSARYRLNQILAWISNYTYPKLWDEIIHLFPNVNGVVISSHTMLDMRLFIHAGIKVNLFKEKVPMPQCVHQFSMFGIVYLEVCNMHWHLWYRSMRFIFTSEDLPFSYSVLVSMTFSLPDSTLR